MRFAVIDADPYSWPFDRDFTPAHTALQVIDMQTDFCGPGGYADSMGYDLTLNCAPIEPIRALLAAARAQVDSDPYRQRPPARPGRTARQQALALAADRALVGDPGPCGRILARGERGREIIPELAPLPGEPILD